MNLKKYLRDQGYDLIEGPIRNHKPLQLWLKKSFDEIELYYANLSHAFTSDIPLNEFTNNALSINSTKKNEYNFNIGITLLEDILKSIGIGNVDLSAMLKSGKKVTISYDNSITKEFPTGEIENYLSNADFKHYNPALLKNANRNNIIIVSGIVYAKNLNVDIEIDFDINVDLIAKLNAIADGKLNFSTNNTSHLKMTSNDSGYFPIAVKANRIDFDKSEFIKLILVTDNRNFF